MSLVSSTNSARNPLDRMAGSRYKVDAPSPGAFSAEGQAAFMGLAQMVVKNGAAIAANWGRLIEAEQEDSFSLSTGTNQASTGMNHLEAGSNVTIGYDATTKTFTISAAASGTSRSFLAAVDYYRTATIPAGGGTVTVTLDSAFDWRTAQTCHEVRMAYNCTAAQLANGYPSIPGQKNESSTLTTDIGGYPAALITMAAGSFRLSLVVASSGNLTLELQADPGETGTNVARLAVHCRAVQASDAGASYSSLALT